MEAVPAEQAEAPGDLVAADAPTPEQPEQGDVPTEQIEAPAEAGATDSL